MPFICRISAFLMVAGFVFPALCGARGITIEAESFAAHTDTGGQAIQSLPLSGCSGGNILIGLDHAGEWTDYDVAIPQSGEYTFMMKCRGDEGVTYTLRLVFTPTNDGSAQTVDFTFTGGGYG